MLKPQVVRFVVSLMTFEEILFSDRSTLRLRQRMGLDPKDTHANAFLGELKQLVIPFGHLPLRVGNPTGDGKPVLEPQQSAASLVVRLAPAVRGK